MPVSQWAGQWDLSLLPLPSPAFPPRYTLLQDLWDHLKLTPPQYDSYEAACAAVAELEAAEAAAAASGLAPIEEESDNEGPEDGAEAGSDAGSDGEQEDGDSQAGAEGDDEDVARWAGRRAGGKAAIACWWRFSRLPARKPHSLPAPHSMCLFPPFVCPRLHLQAGERRGGGRSHGGPCCRASRGGRGL